MTLEEKCAQLGSVFFSSLLVEGELDETRVGELLSNGIGQISKIAGSSFEPVRAARFGNELQRFLIERTRLGVPALVHEEALEGLLGPGATEFPQAIGMAAS